MITKYCMINQFVKCQSILQIWHLKAFQILIKVNLQAASKTRSSKAFATLNSSLDTSFFTFCKEGVRVDETSLNVHDGNLL